MYLLKEKIISSEIDSEQALQLKRIYGIRRIPQYFLSLLNAGHQMDLTEEDNGDLGIIYVSHLGPIQQVGKYVDDLLTFPPEECSPAYFSHSVFNAPVAFLTKHLNIQGSSLSVCGFQQIIKSSILTAYSWLKTSYTSKVLLIYSDDISNLSLKISELTGLELFKNHYILLLGNKSSGEENRFTPEQIIDLIKQKRLNGEI